MSTFNLSSALIDQFVKVTKDEKEVKTENTHYGTIVAYDGKHYVKIDGSDQLTPIPATTTNAKDGERVRVTIKNHTLTVTGNISNPSATTGEMQEVEKQVGDISDQITEFEIVIADKIVAEDIEAINGYFESIKSKVGQFDHMEAVMAEIDELQAKYASLDHITATDIEALNADIENLKSEFGDFTHISAEDIEAINAEFDNLKAYNATFTYVSAEVLEAMKADIKEADIKYAKIDFANINEASIKNLFANKATTDELDAKYANIDLANVGEATIDKLISDSATIQNLNTKYANINFANIGEAAVEKIFSESGIIEDLIVREGKITGELVGVTIKGDLIEGNTIKADKLVVKGSDGIYYKLNFEAGTFKDGEAVPTDALHGSVIAAKSITAEKVAVTDLVAFGATIGGFKIGQNSLYSDVKSTVNNTTRGVYMDTDGQFAVGDSDNYLKFFKDTDGKYKLKIAAESLEFAASGKSVQETIDDVKNDVETLRSEITTLLRIESSRGTVFKNDKVATVLSAVIYHGTQRITDSATMHSVFGANAYLQWKWQRLDDDSFGVILSSDSRFGDNGFTFTLSPEDVDTKVTFMCELIV